MSSFLQKTKQFFKRNIYPITVSFCTVLVLGIITVSAYSSIKNSNQVIDTNQTTQNPENSDNVSGSQGENGTPTNANDTIIFGLPFENATISKEYADSSLLYDTTTKLWCTHQGLDFACTEGQEVKAVYDGKITKVESSMMNGTVVHLQVSEGLTVVYKGITVGRFIHAAIRRKRTAYVITNKKIIRKKGKRSN